MEELPFKIGIWVDKDYQPETGGGYSYTQRLINEIDNTIFNQKIEIVIVGFEINSVFQKPILNLEFKENYILKKIVNFFHKFFSLKINLNNTQKNYEKAHSTLKENNIELLFYSDPYVRIPNFPYIVSNWDLGHKSTYAFPEFSMNNQYEFRDQDSSKILNKAIFVCCESEAGKAELSHFLKINPKRLKVLPMFPGAIVTNSIIAEKPKWLNGDRFFIYPAQFWPHKNHYNLILAFKEFLEKTKYNDFKLILSGSDKGNLGYIKETITKYDLLEHVHIAGFIKNEELKWLYKNSIGLVFPSFLGPTNMPLLEAATLGCNIACSNLEGHIEILGEKGIYFEPELIGSICNSLIELNINYNINKESKEMPITSQVMILEQIFLDCIPIRRTWGKFDKIF